MRRSCNLRREKLLERREVGRAREDQRKRRASNVENGSARFAAVRHTRLPTRITPEDRWRQCARDFNS